MQIDSPQQHGFSLVEVLVSLTLFTIVITISVGSLLVLIDANAKAQNLQEVMTNVTFAVDSMSREIRTGRGYYCSNNLPDSISIEATQNCSQASSISVVEGGSSLTAGSGNSRIAYRIANGAIERRVGDGNWLPLTSDKVTIDTMYFTVSDTATYSDASDMIQPTATIYIEGTAGTKEDLDTDFSIQTTVTRRVRDI